MDVWNKLTLLSDVNTCSFPPPHIIWLLDHLWPLPPSPHRTRTVLLRSSCLRRAQAGQLLRGLGVDDGGVAPLQVFRDAHHVAVALVQLPLGEEVLKLRSAIDALDWRGGRQRGGEKREGEESNWIHFFSREMSYRRILGTSWWKCDEDSRPNTLQQCFGENTSKLLGLLVTPWRLK